MSRLEAKLAALAGVAERLNSATDQLNESIEAVEDALQRAGVGVEVWLYEPLLRRDWTANDAQDGYEGSGWWELGFAKTQERWRIAARRVELLRKTADGPQGHCTRQERDYALLKAPRSVRVECAGYIESLVERLAGASACMLADVESARRQVEVLRDRLRNA